ncbi:LysR family transcriptional regulator [Tropicibacter naphthalenivorans]|uniref:HTH-type transcriptional regulator CbbR n=1 Tax=Tropicibacter naphthalenivorans TaxID=441103 RepID=A0A0N7M168_9RHOB|nr:LysR family transcriptional regulator [Tropicibacter naphthalenivorans]CUH82425.1 HTH-type transcriptional activator CmpR [Tropicibacter naphthalenivorans]SMD06256.1 ModE molybdate transport repressor domain-containing protein [Tropicibacter naphthalenivorans]
MKRLDQLTLKQMRALSAVVDEGTISAAADRLGLTGPAIHSQLKSLEDIIGAPLLIREGRERNTPTAQGQAILDAYSELRAAMARALHRINALNSGLEGSVVLGVVSTGKYFAPRIVAQLHKELPGIEVILKVGNRQEILAALEKRELDICIMGRPPRAPQVDARPLAQHPHILIASADHPLAQKDLILREDLFEQKFVVREPGSGTRILATRFLDETGTAQKVSVVEMSSNETIKQAVIYGLGIALISAHTVADELRSGRLIALPCHGLPIYRTWYILSRADQRLSATAEKVRDWAISHAAELLPDLKDLKNTGHTG